jgi:hypothetical protein
MDRERYAALLVVVGLLFLSNGAWAYPDGVSYADRYVYEAERTAEPEAGSIANCDFYPLSSRGCAVENYLADGNEIRYDAAADGVGVETPLSAGHDYVQVYGNDYYRPTERVENETAVVGLEPVSRERVLRSLAENYSEVRPVVRRAVREGNATATLSDDTPTRNRWYVERDGAFYTVRAHRTGRVPTGWGWTDPPQVVVEALRLAGWIGGVALLVRAGQVSVE